MCHAATCDATSRTYGERPICNLRVCFSENFHLNFKEQDQHACMGFFAISPAECFIISKREKCTFFPPLEYSCLLHSGLASASFRACSLDPRPVQPPLCDLTKEWAKKRKCTVCPQNMDWNTFPLPSSRPPVGRKCFEAHPSKALIYTLCPLLSHGRKIPRSTFPVSNGSLAHASIWPRHPLETSVVVFV